MVEVVSDYDSMFGQDFTIATDADFKKDLSARPAHRKPYLSIENDPSQQLNLLIVVDQMLTGFDSKWVNTLYLDKVLKHENVIQAFSRTNRLFGIDKPFGTIRYYRKPATMERNVKEAVALYAGGHGEDLCVDRLTGNLEELNRLFYDITAVFETSGIPDFSRLPANDAAKACFARLFNDFYGHLEAAIIQGFTWGTPSYEPPEVEHPVRVECDESTFLTLVARYRELNGGGGGGGGDESTVYDLDTQITEINTERIDTDYLNSTFKRFVHVLHRGDASRQEVEALRKELQRSFSSLSQDEQRHAEVFLRDVESGKRAVESGKTMRDYLTEMLRTELDQKIDWVADVTGVDRGLLTQLVASAPTEGTLNTYGRFDALRATISVADVKRQLASGGGSDFMARKTATEVLRSFLLTGTMPKEWEEETGGV